MIFLNKHKKLYYCISITWHFIHQKSGITIFWRKKELNRFCLLHSNSQLVYFCFVFNVFNLRSIYLECDTFLLCAKPNFSHYFVTFLQLFFFKSQSCLDQIFNYLYQDLIINKEFRLQRLSSELRKNIFFTQGNNLRLDLKILLNE